MSHTSIGDGNLVPMTGHGIILALARTPMKENTFAFYFEEFRGYNRSLN